MSTLVLLALTMGCGTKKALSELEDRNATCEQELTACNARVKTLEQQIAGSLLAKDLADKRLDAYRTLAKELRDALGTDLSIEIRNGRMIVKLSTAILFDTGKATLRADGEKTLAKAAPALKKDGERSYQIAGHTDNRPISAKSTTFKDNWELSTARALTAVRYLNKQGVKADRLAAAGYGENQPVAKNDTEENMQKNRRLEIVVMPKLNEIPTFPTDL